MFMNNIRNFFIYGVILASAMHSTYPTNVEGNDIITFNFKPENTEVRYSMPSVGYGQVDYEIIRDEPIIDITKTLIPEITSETPATEKLVATNVETSAEITKTVPETLKVYAPISQYDCEGMYYQDAVDAYAKAGFTNIMVTPYEIEYTEGIGGNNEIATFSVDGEFGFEKGTEFDSDAPVKISYRKWINIPENTRNTISEKKIEEKIYAQRGDINENVREMQKALINLGYLYDSADGDFGNNTENAVKKFQQANGFEDDGILTESQAEKLWKSSSAVTASRSNSGGTQQSFTNSSSNQANSVNERTVYITPTGKKYHYSASCAGKNAISTTLDIAEKSYGPCKKCVG